MKGIELFQLKVLIIHDKYWAINGNASLATGGIY